MSVGLFTYYVINNPKKINIEEYIRLLAIVNDFFK
jgi:hypothetical protein